MNLCLRSVLQGFTYTNDRSLPLLFIQIRCMSRVKRRKTHPYHKWPKQNRVQYQESLSPENKNFLKDVVHDSFGPECVVGGASMPYVSPLKEPPWERGTWNEGVIRTGVIGRQIGVYPMWKTDGTRILTTLIQVVDNHVIRYKTPEEVMRTTEGLKKFGYRKPLGALVVGAESVDPQLFTKEYCNLFTESGVMPKRKLARFYISPESAIQPGTPLLASHFKVGQYVDVQGKTIDRGFQGVMRRWAMRGGPASHGATKFHRRPGGIGSGQEMARVWPGKKMPGHMGGETRMITGLKVWRINTKYNVLWVHGPAIPGAVNSYVHIRDCRFYRKRHKTEPPFPTMYSEEGSNLEEELYAEGLHIFGSPSITISGSRSTHN